MISAIPVALALFRLIAGLLRRQLPRPRWLRPFVTEEFGSRENFETNGQKFLSERYPALIVISAFGLLPHVLAIFHDGFKIHGIMLGAAWVRSLCVLLSILIRTVHHLVFGCHQTLQDGSVFLARCL